MKTTHAYLKLVGVTFLMALAACASRTGGPMSGPTSESPSTVPAPQASRIISPRENTWNFDVTPVPAPSRKPDYRLNEITFTEGSTVFGPEGSGVCRDTAAQIQSMRPSHILLLGYTHKGEPQNLAMDRTKKVKACLVDHGLSPEIFELSSFGSTFSKADGTEPMLMEQERRVEIWIVTG